MISSYVCRQCRNRLIQRVTSSRNPQWQSRATFISLRNEKSNPKPPPGSSSVDNESPRNQHRGGKTRSHGEDKGYTTRRLQLDGIGHPSSAGRYSRYAQSVQAPGQSQDLTADIEDTGNAVSQPNAPTEQSQVYMIRQSLVTGNLNKAWERFIATYTSKDCAALSQPSYQDLSWIHGGKIFRELLGSLVASYCKGADVPASPTLVLQKYQELDIFKYGPTAWRDTIRKLTDQALSRMSAESQDIAGIEHILTELLSVWRLFFQCNGPRKAPLEPLGTEWTSIPDLDTLKSAIADPSMPRDFTNRLHLYHPGSSSSPALGFSAVIVFNLLREGSSYTSGVSDSLRANNVPFLNFLAHILPGARMESIQRHIEASPQFRRLPSKFRSQITDEMKAAPHDAMTMVGSQMISNKQLSESEKAANLESFLIKRIERAIVEQSHKERLDRLWAETVRTYSRENNRSAIPLKIYNSFLTGYLALFAADRSVEVWNHMFANGKKPDVMTWTAMLTGCEKARDLNGLNAMWQRMVQSGIQPDLHAWTTRIHGLISLRQINAGFAAMDEMGRQWLAAEQATATSSKQSPKNIQSVKAVNKFIKPSVEIINGSISAMAKIPQNSLPFERKAESIRKILQWASNFEIRPDAQTYNILIKLYMRGGDHSTTFKLLAQMEAQGLEADTATYSMLIQASFENQSFDGLSQQEQITRVTELFDHLESSGVKLNSYIYSTAIDRLLKQHSNHTAARAIIDRMMSRNLIPGAHIYTSLLTHYFQQNPPNIPAVDSLWNRILMTPGTPTDKILFDRLIEGYAAVGEIGKMMAVLASMSRHGKLPGWTALSAAVRALVAAGDWQRARDVVRDVQNGEGVAQGGITGGRHGQGEFFAMVRALRILEGEQVSQQAWREEVQAQSQESEATEEAWRETVRDIGESAEEQGVDLGTRPPADDSAKNIREMNVRPRNANPEQKWRAEDNGSIGGIPL